MHRENLVVLLGRKNSAVWCEQLCSYQQSFYATPKKPEHGDGAVHNADFLMIDGEEPCPPSTGISRARKGTCRKAGISRFKFEDFWAFLGYGHRDRSPESRCGRVNLALTVGVHRGSLDR